MMRVDEITWLIGENKPMQTEIANLLGFPGLGPKNLPPIESVGLETKVSDAVNLNMTIMTIM